jgi:hypothetical protein
VIPVILEQGSVGASGDLAPLAQLGAAMLGHGEAFLGTKKYSAAAALRRARLAPYRFRAKEALSLINGTPFTAALLARVLADAEELFKLADIAGAMSLEALKGSLKPFDPRFHKHRPHPGQLAAAHNIRALLLRSEVLESHRQCQKVQDAYSLRCIPQVHGAARDAWSFARDILVREANSVTDNPLVFENGDILSGGNFHGQSLAQAADFLTTSLVSLANISERRIDRMTNPEMSELPAFLVTESGLNSGYMMVQVARRGDRGGVPRRGVAGERPLDPDRRVEGGPRPDVADRGAQVPPGARQRPQGRRHGAALRGAGARLPAAAPAGERRPGGARPPPPRHPLPEGRPLPAARARPGHVGLFEAAGGDPPRGGEGDRPLF